MPHNSWPVYFQLRALIETYFMKTVVIIGHPHSGSTILARYLSRLDRTIALGEVRDIFRGKPHSGSSVNLYCSCGSTMGECSVWKKKYEDRAELYESLRPHYDVVIDSSKVVLHGDVRIYLYKSFWGILKSALKQKRPVWSFYRMNIEKYKAFLVTRFTGEFIRLPYSKFRKNPEEILMKVAQLVDKSVDGSEDSHIAYSNESKFAPLKIV